MARSRRLKKNGDACYHVMSRTNDRRFLFGKGRFKSRMIGLLKRAAEFSGVKLIAYCMMDDHFHIVCRIVRPEGSVPEAEVLRRIAREEGLGVESKPDSQEICFVPDGDYARFVEDFTGVRSVPGSFVDPQGRVLGTHRGLIHYTVGQRKGLGLAFGEPRFVTELRPAANEVVLGLNEDCFARGLIAEGLNWQALGEEELGGVGNLAEAASLHLKDAYLGGRAEPVFQRTEDAEPIVAVALKLEDGVHDMFHHLRACQRAILGNMSHKDDRHPALLRIALKFGGTFPYLGDASCRGVDIFGTDSLYGVDNEEVGVYGFHVVKDTLSHRLGDHIARA